jgi:hypothetical protein
MRCHKHAAPNLDLRRPRAERVLLAAMTPNPLKSFFVQPENEHSSMVPLELE